MRTILLVALLLAGATVVAPAPLASAHTCDFFDAPCVAFCLAHAWLGGDLCSVRAPDWPTDPILP